MAYQPALNPQPVKLPDVATTSTLAALNAAVTTAVNSQGIVAIQLTGTWVGTIAFQGTEDPAGAAAATTSWFNVNGVQSVTGAQLASTTVNGQYRVNSGGYTAVRAIMTVFTSGSATAWANASLAASMATLAEPLPTGTNNIGAMTTTDGTNVANVLKSDGTSVGQNSQLVSQTDLVSNGTITTQNLNLNTGVATAGSFVGPLTLSGSSMVGIQLSGTYTGQIVPQVSNDGGTNWVTLSASGVFYKKSNGTSVNTLTAESGFFQIAIAGAGLFRLTMANAPSGSAVIQMRSTNASNVVTVGAALPAGTFTIGAVTQSGTWGVSSNFASGSAMPANVFPMGISDGSNLQAARSNWNTTTGDTGAKTTSFTGATQTNFNQQSAYITVLCGTVSGTTPTLTAQLQWSPDAGTTWLNLGTATTAITTTANTALIMVGPENWSQAAGTTPATLTTGATTQVALNAPLPRTWRLNYVIGGTTPSFAITGVYINYVGV